MVQIAFATGFTQVENPHKRAVRLKVPLLFRAFHPRTVALMGHFHCIKEPGHGV